MSAMRGVARGALLVAMSASATAAAPTEPSVAVDLNGDGAVEVVSGKTVLAIGGMGTVRLPGEARLGTLVAAGLGSERLMAVELDVDAGARGTQKKRELWVGRLTASGFAELARLPLGPQGGDGEYGAAAELSAKGLWRWQTRGDLVRCDGAALRLFAQRWDPVSRKWQAAESSEVPLRGDGVATVTPGAALPAVGAGRPGSGRTSDVFRARLVSSQRGATRADELAIPSELDDGDPATAWKIASESRNDGRGEVIGFQARLAAGKALRLRVVPGDASSAAAMRASSRPAKIWIVGKRQTFAATLPDPVAGAATGATAGAATAGTASGGAAWIVTLPQPIEGCLSVVVESVYSGTGSGAGSGTGRGLAISELSVETDLEDQSGGTQALAAQVGRGGDEGARAATILARRGPAAAVALGGELAQATEVARKRRLARALAMLSEKEIGAPLTAALREGWIAEEEIDETVGALSRVGHDEGLAEIVAAPAAAEKARRRAAILLSLAASPRLTALAGVGGAEIRQAVIEGLAALPSAALLAAADQAGSPAATGDLWRAAVRGVIRAPSHASVEVVLARQLAAELAARWPTAVEYERRYRLATARAELAARTGEPDAVPALLAQLTSIAEPERSALRQAVAEVVARRARPELVPSLEALLRDPDAGVRLAVIRGLADLSAGAGPSAGPSPSPGPGTGAAWPAPAIAALDAAVLGTLAADRWPELRRAAAAALGHRCQRAEPAAALGRSVDGDADVDVRQDALVALVTCRAPGIGERLARTWESGKAPLPLRGRAVSLSVMLGDASLAARLIRSLSRWRSEAFSDETSLQLAVLAAGALGRLGGPHAAAALLDALGDGAYPELVAASASALGALGPACPPAARARLQALTRSDERQISLAAKRAVGRCGSIAAPARAVPEP
jgi:hypothetical protein